MRRAPVRSMAFWRSTHLTTLRHLAPFSACQRSNRRTAPSFWHHPSRFWREIRPLMPASRSHSLLAKHSPPPRKAPKRSSSSTRICPLSLIRPSAHSESAQQIWPEAPANTSFLWRDGDHSKTEAALRQAPKSLKLRIENNRLIVASIEARAAVGEWDGSRFTLTTASQGGHSLRLQLAEHLFRLPEDAFRVVTPEVGGGFGMKIFMYPEQPLVLFAARDLGRPIRWSGERSADAFPSDYHGRDQVNDIEVGFDADGRILALRVQTSANLGAFVSNFAPYIATECGAAMLSGVYAIPAIALEVRGVFTNTVPVDAYRGPDTRRRSTSLSARSRPWRNRSGLTAPPSAAGTLFSRRNYRSRPR